MPATPTEPRPFKAGRDRPGTCSRGSSRVARGIRGATVFCLLACWLTGHAVTAVAADPENCLLCHRYQGLSRMDDDGEAVRLYYVDPDYYDRALGPHAQLRCTACHERTEVEVIPHQPVSPVDCTRTCHLQSPGQVETLFAHDTIESALQSSVHNRDVLDESNRLLDEPLAENQARCLLCHDEPTFRRGDHTWAEQEAGTRRCSVCHTDMLQQDTSYYYWHVLARTRPAWSPERIVRSCSTCHANEKIQNTFELSNATATYLASFHGKAMLLGDDSTAHCLDCHAPEMGDIHMTLASSNPDSSTHPGRLPDTCRSAACHPGAGERITSAAIHLDLSTSRGVEYFIGALFVLLIVSTFGPSVVLQSLELLHIVIGRHDPEHHAREEKARRLMADPRRREKLIRFTPHQRLQHWFLFATFTALVLTGFPIKFADRDWAPWLIDMMGNLEVARTIHRIAGLGLIFGMIYHLVFVGIAAWQEKRNTGKPLWKVALDLPMVARPEDLKYLLKLLGYLLFLRKQRPEAGRFSLKEKFEYFGVFWGSMLLGVTGILMWENAWFTRYVPGRLLTISSLVHTFEAYLAFLHVFVIHMIGVILMPTVFPLSRAMLSGETPPAEMAEAHSLMLAEADRNSPADTTKEKHDG